ncbi:MAG: sodium:solute symporter [Pirellulales bacterium]
MCDFIAATNVAIGPLDGAIVVAYLVGTTLFGVMLGRGQANNRDYFLGGHRLPTWALLVSIVATETSTVTFLSVPGKSYGKTYLAPGDFTFLQIAFGYVLGRFAVIAFLLPGYFRGEMLSAYQVLERRFGTTTRRLASLVFLITRNVADGLRLFLTALALQIALGLDMISCILLTTIATAIYSAAGGVRSVVWNDCIQFAIYMLGAFAAAYLLLSQLPGGWDQLVTFGEATGRWRFLDFDPSLTKPTMTFWSGLIGGGFLSLATHGVDQLIVQRYLCARSHSAASWALGLSGVVVFAQFALFLFIGVELACFNSATGGIGSNLSGDQAFMTYVVNHMGPGLKGLILAAVLSAAMSTLASSLNSSASSLVADWLHPFLPALDDRQSLRLSRVLTLIFAAIQGGVAIAAYQVAIQHAIVDAVLTIAGFAIGLLLGLYGLGLISPRTPEWVALTAFTVGTAVTTYVAFGTPLNGYWYTLVGSGTIVTVGLAISFIARFVRWLMRW